MTAEPSYDARLEFVFETVKLHLWFLRKWLSEHEKDSLPETLRRRVDIFRRTDLYAGGPIGDAAQFEHPPWPSIEASLAALHERTRGDADSSRFEAEGLAILADRLAAGTRRRYDAGWDAAMRRMSPDGCLRFDPPKPERPRRVMIHIANVVSPRSLFDDPAYLPSCLRGVIARARDEHDADSLETATWLNSHPRWLAAFPTEWAAHLAEPMTEPGVGLGWWGQFINARGLLHRRNAAAFRRTGAMPFLPRASWCTFRALEEHLDKLETTDKSF